MAVPAHRLTGAQVCAGQATQPALVWTSDPTGDWLASNGVPGWYDPDGASHQAQAHTWRHPPSGANGSPGQPDPAAGFLPLTHHDATSAWRHRPALIDMPRRAARTGAHWFTLDTTTTGTGRFAVSDHRHDIAPPTATWVPAAVTSPSVEDQCYPGAGRRRVHHRRWGDRPVRPGGGVGDGRVPARPTPRPEPCNRPDAR